MFLTQAMAFFILYSNIVNMLSDTGDILSQFNKKTSKKIVTVGMNPAATIPASSYAVYSVTLTLILMVFPFSFVVIFVLPTPRAWRTLLSSTIATAFFVLLNKSLE